MPNASVSVGTCNMCLRERDNSLPTVHVKFNTTTPTGWALHICSSYYKVWFKAQRKLLLLWPFHLRKTSFFLA